MLPSGAGSSQKGTSAETIDVSQAKPNRALAVLELFSERKPHWTPDEMMRQLGYSRPTLYRQLKSLKDAGFLAAARGGFTLGPRIVEMDFLSREADPLIAAAAPHLARLVAARPCTALIVRWYGDKMLCVASQSSADSPRTSYPRGKPMPMGRGAISRSILAFLPKRRLTPLIEAYAADLRDVGTGSTPEEVIATLRKIRRSGLAVAFGEVTPGAVGIAAPILDAGEPVASLCVTIAGRHADGKAIDQIGTEVRAAALGISAGLSG